MKLFKSKAIIFLAILLILATLPSCRSNNASRDADVHVFYYTFSDPYISSVRSEISEEMNEKGISYQEHDGRGNQTTQTEQIQTAITNGAKCLIVNIVNTGSDDASRGIVEMAKNANIPLIFFNREVSDEVINSYDKCVFVGTDAAEAGKLQGEMIYEYLIKDYDKYDLNRDGKISYVLFKGEEGNREAVLRTKHSVEVANEKLRADGKPTLEFYDKSNPNKYLVDKNGLWSATAANEYMTTILSSYNENRGNMVELVICNNDGMAEGAISALSSIGYNNGSGKSIPVFGVDATSAARELIRDGKMAGTIKQDPEGMAEAIVKIAQNREEDSLLLGLDDYNIDPEVDKIRISYSKYSGED